MRLLLCCCVQHVAKRVGQRKEVACRTTLRLDDNMMARDNRDDVAETSIVE
jgi:hypothetical protein